METLIVDFKDGQETWTYDDFTRMDLKRWLSHYPKLIVY